MKAEKTVGEAIRHYEPVVDMLPGNQCQVDAGELRNVLIDGVARTVYFVVFVLSCSRLMHVCASLVPIATELFIRMHDTAFRAFGGMPEECVYDQTKLVVIHEQYRELELNNRFACYATTAGFRIHCCRGYDPESKGKVESGVRYVKENCLYGESFADADELHQHIAHWLENVANVRIHGTTGRQPVEHYRSDEQSFMKPYLSPAMPEVFPKLQRRKVDKTGLISWEGNRYSVPMKFQRGEVYVQTQGNELLIHNIAGVQVASWILGAGKGALFKNNNHYRDPTEQISVLEEKLGRLLQDERQSSLVQERLRHANPRIYKDQLRGLCHKLEHPGPVEEEIMCRLLARKAFSMKQFVDAVEAWRAHPERLQKTAEAEAKNSDLLEAYARVGQHVIH